MEDLAQDVLGVRLLQLYGTRRVIYVRIYRKPERAFFVKRPSTGSGRPELVEGPISRL
jgi:hypothetical protein